MGDFHQKRSLEEFNDRELLLFILANQVTLYRRTQYLEQFITHTESEHIGFHSDTFKALIQDADSVLRQADEYLDQEDSDKGFLKF